LAQWIAGPSGSHSRARAQAGIDAQGEDPREGGDDLSAFLAAISDEVHRHSAAARDGVITDFAARMAHARKHLSPHLLAAALAAFKEQRKAALATVRRNAASELAGRKKAAIMASRPKHPRSAHKRTGAAPETGPQRP
jgi:hypothetical protein